MMLCRFLLVAVLPGSILISALQAQMAEEALPESTVGEPGFLDDTLPLIPDSPEMTDPPEYVPDLPESSGVRQSLDPVAASETRLAIERQQQQIKMRQARMKAEGDPEVQAALAQADSAKTDAERRFAMHLYYDRLSAVMLKLDPTLKQEDLKARRDTALAPLSQDRIRPSVWAGDPNAAR